MMIEELLSYEILLANRLPTPIRGGVIYALFSNDELVYIGESTCFDSRLSSHLFNNKLKFDSYTVIVVPHLSNKQRKILEKKYIDRFNPKYNGGFVRRLKPKKLNTYKPKYNGISIDIIEKHVKSKHDGSAYFCKLCNPVAK